MFRMGLGKEITDVNKEMEGHNTERKHTKNDDKHMIEGWRVPKLLSFTAIIATRNGTEGSKLA